MQAAPLVVVREVHRSMREWIANSEARSESFESLDRISAGLRHVDQAIREASPSVVASTEWRDTLSAYSETLGELGARLGELEITLRIRQMQLAHASSRLGALHSWSELARRIG